MKGKKVLKIHRHGKFLWWEMEKSPHPVFHLGMTGHFASPGIDNIKLESGFEVGEQWPPRFWKVHMEFENGKTRHDQRPSLWSHFSVQRPPH